jgi:hypothetical protein
MVKFCLFALVSSVCLHAQGGARGVPGLTERQTHALEQMSSGLQPQLQAVASARSALTSAAFAEPRDPQSIDRKAEELRLAELSLANARADALAQLQSSGDKLNPEQVRALIAAGGVLRNPGAPRTPIGTNRGTIPGIKQAQTTALTQLTTDTMPLTRAVAGARNALTAAALAQPRNDADIRTKADELKKAELAVATARASAIARIQGSSIRLDRTQLAAFVELGGTFAGIAFTQPEPLSFADHEGYVSLFDGKTLKGWDGNPKFWRVEDGAIIGESTPQNPSGNSYIAYRDLEAKDFTLKFEMKVEGTGGSGFQYRSKTGIPWLSPIPDNVTANVGPVNLNWMMTGPQADFWPSSKDWTGQFYSENTPMRILAWRGQVVEGAGLGRKRLMGEIGDRQALGALTKMNDWNEYTVIARGGTCMHILNGQLMAVFVDDDPESSNNQSGLFGIEIEATTKIFVRNIWVKKLN